MIISASRRTDIPAFYSEWFYNRIKEGFLYVQNPMNRKQISKIILTPEVVDCIVFWTKDPSKFMNRLSEIDDYTYYFQYTLNAYGSNIEVNVPELEKSIETFKRLSDKLGPDRVVWRYDPIFLTSMFNVNTHINLFYQIAEKLQSYTKKCVISFLDVYKKCERNMKPITFSKLSIEHINEIAQNISNIAYNSGMKVETCAEDVNLMNFGIEKGKCVDDKLIEKISNKNINVMKDKTQREVCGCVSSIDIGAYNTCLHNCLYCYANFDYKIVNKNSLVHDPNSPLLTGKLIGDEKITERKMKSLFDQQMGLF